MSFLGIAFCLLPILILAQPPVDTLHVVPKQRVIVVMVDGFGPEYLAASDMPFLKKIMRQGFYKEVNGMMPSVTSVNNASINCGVVPARHGIAGNTFFDLEDGKEKLMEDSSHVQAPTISERAKKYGIRSALFSSKLKTIKILSKGTEISISPEIATPAWIDAAGPVPDKYSSEVNFWTCRALIHTLKTRPDIGLYYLHTTDYPMHMWEANDPRSLAHLHTLDSLLNAMSVAAPDAAIFITADHGMNHKSRVLDLKNILTAHGLSIVTAISPLKDLYPKHHKGFGGVSYVYLKNKKDFKNVSQQLEKTEGIEKVFTREEFAKQFGQIPGRIGDIIVFGDKQTVFGELDSGVQSENLPTTYRTHGSLYESKVPVFIYNIAIPDKSYFRRNLDLARWLY
jgi:phosphonoacetate hydrolase